MWEDPIVAEVQRTRAELAAAFNFDLKAIFADLRQRQAALGARLVQPKQKPTGVFIPVPETSQIAEAAPVFNIKIAQAR